MSKCWLFPPEANLLKTLSDRIQDPKDSDDFFVPETYVFMPTRRSCRLLEKIFLQNSKKKSTLLPTIMPIGDPPIDLLPLQIRTEILQKATQPNENSFLQEKIMATELIESLPLFSSMPWNQCFSIAQDLLSFYETITTQGIEPHSINLEKILPVSTHNQHQIEFLKIFLKKWPEVLKENNLIDRGTFRHNVLCALSKFWQQNPIKTSIFAILSAGWIPPVLNLIKTLAALPLAEIWIHGAPTPFLQQNILNNLPSTHPFDYLRKLNKQLDALGVSMHPYPGIEKKAKKSTTLLPAFLPREKNIFSANSINDFSQSFSLHTCQSEEEEAYLIALSLRATLLENKKTAALVTPDKALTKRVQAYLQRWNITIDSSAGIPLNEKGVVQLCLQSLNLLKENLSFFSILNLLRSPFLKQKLQINIKNLKKYRENFSTKSFEVLLETNKKKEDWAEVFILRDKLLSKKKQPIKEWLVLYVAFLENLLEEKNWELEEACSFIQALDPLASLDKIVSQSQFTQLLHEHIAQQTFRATQNNHPRLSILGLRESRLIHVDKLILSGLNEGIWPCAPAQNMWQYTHLQKELGLPTDKTKISYDGFDFWVNLSAASTVLLTRSIKNSQGPTTPSRWLNYLQLYFEKNNFPLKENSSLNKALLDLKTCHDATQAIERPTGQVSLKNKPRCLSITQIEKFIKDPYLLYCQKILNLHPLTAPKTTITALDFGILVHAALEKYMLTSSLAENESLLQILSKEITYAFPDTLKNPFWKKRMEKIVNWIMPHFKYLKEEKIKSFPELWTEMKINPHLMLIGKIDRIDVFPEGLSIVDYKTGMLPTKKSVVEGTSLQLPLSAMLAEYYMKTKKNHSFKNKVTKVAYWALQAKQPTIISLQEGDLKKSLETAHLALKAVSNAWLEEKTLFKAANSCLDPLYIPLERQQEWKR